ncbi:MAG: hypothetical protein ACTH5M_08980 [Psychrobacter sp.]|uniref:hypothetical protein n=1 Tax=Psychrobacter sp. AOP7-B1-24 TaxID=3457645 RepID=UPI003FB7DFE0
MISIQHNIKANLKLPKALLAGLFVMGSAMSAAHSELVIQEKNPGSSIVNQFATLKDANAQSPELHQLIADLNQRLAVNPSDTLAWDILAQIYYNNGYHDYAIYAASEAIDRGKSTATLKSILLNSSIIVAQKQLQTGYLNNVDVASKIEYQHTLSKVAGNVYGFNYDESLPKPPPKPIRRSNPTPPKPIKRSKPAPTPSKPTRSTSPKPTVSQPASNNTPVSTDPFKNVRPRN